jgi:SAM-dependent methyltransferase
MVLTSSPVIPVSGRAFWATGALATCLHDAPLDCTNAISGRAGGRLAMSVQNQTEERTTREDHETVDVDFAEVNEGKSDFDSIYNAPDPRGYCRTLSKLDYRIPAEAKPVFRSLIHALQADGRESLRLIDLGCSYGINAALLKHGMHLGGFFKRYTSPKIEGAADDVLLRRESAFFDTNTSDDAIEMVGIDVADRALEFADSVGLLDDVVRQNLEEQALTEENRELVEGADLIISTGCVGYVTDKTFRHILDATADAGDPPYVASFVLRMFPYEPIADALADYGLVTEKLHDVTFRQRRFENDDERNHVFEQLRAQGIDPDLEQDGYYHAEFFLSRPAHEARERPLGYLV